ncbi:MAG: hypothetical protein E3J72_11520 [Planctomycetota bacterium]|nr:MAG: hypothetical protein E3J72_11520 [Planctomycetota bacterium]
MYPARINSFNDEKGSGRSSGNRQLFINVGIIVGVFLAIIVLAVVVVNRLVIPPEHAGDTGFRLPEVNYASIFKIGGRVLHKPPGNSGWQIINKRNAREIALREGHKLSTVGNESYLVFSLDPKSHFLLTGNGCVLTFEKFDKAGEILLILDEGTLDGDVDETRGYNIRIRSGGQTDVKLKGTQFKVTSSRRESHVSVARGSVSVSKAGTAKFGMVELIKEGYQITSLGGRLGLKSKITDPSLLELDAVLKKAMEEKELTRIEQEEIWEKAIIWILQEWARKGITDVGTTRNRLYSEPPGYTTETITLIMGAYRGREWGKVPPVRFGDLPQIHLIRGPRSRFEFPPVPGNRTYEKILDRLFVRSHVKEAKLMFIDKQRVRGRRDLTLLPPDERQAEEKKLLKEAEKRARERTEFLGVLSHENRITFRITSTEDYVKTSAFHGNLSLHGLQAEEDEENYSIPGGSAFTYWIHKPELTMDTFQPHDLGVDDFLAYAALKEQFWKLSTGVTPKAGEEVEEAPKRREIPKEDLTREGKRKVGSETIWEKEKRKGVDIQFELGGLLAIVNFDMDVTFAARIGTVLPKRVYECFMFFSRNANTTGSEPEHWRAFLGGYRTYCAGKY